MENKLYFNNAATSYPKPQIVLDTVNNFLSNIPYHSLRTGINQESENILNITRNAISKFFNVKNSSNIIFTSGATESLNLVLQGLNLNNANVITTNIEHNSVYRPLNKLETQNQIEINIVKSDENGMINPDLILNYIDNKTKLIIINHASNVLGSISNIKRICEIAKSKKIQTLIDASQSAGLIPIDISDIDADFIAFTGHKSLYSIQGIGFLYIKDDFSIEPLKIGGTGIKSNLLSQPKTMPLYYEAGTYNLPGIASLKAGIDYLAEKNIDEIRKKLNTYYQMIFDELSKQKKIKIYGSNDLTKRLPIFSFNIEGISPDDLGYILDNSFGIIIRSGLHCAPLIHKAIDTYPNGLVRASFSHINTKEEIIYFIDSIKEICKM